MNENIRCYDNKGMTFDRYTVIYLDQPEYAGLYAAVGMSADPFSPLGFCQHTSAMDGPHLGDEIQFSDLPADCQKFILRDLS